MESRWTESSNLILPWAKRRATEPPLRFRGRGARIGSPRSPGTDVGAVVSEMRRLGNAGVTEASVLPLDPEVYLLSKYVLDPNFQG